MKRGDLVRLRPSTAHKFARRTGLVLKVSPSMNGNIATVLLDPTQAYPAVNHFVPVTESGLEVVGRAVRLTERERRLLFDTVDLALDDYDEIAKDEGLDEYRAESVALLRGLTATLGDDGPADG